MDVRFRPMRPKDIGKGAEHLAQHPILGPRYGEVLEHFPSAVSRVLGQDALTAVVFEEFHDSTDRFLGVGMAAFVGDDFLREVKTTPSFWIAPELVKRIVRSKSPLLSNAEVRNANSTVGLNLVVWHDSPHPEDLRRAEVGTAAMNAFEENYRGFQLREVIGQADCLEHLWAMENAGGLYFNRSRGSYERFPEVDAGNFSDDPRNVGMTRELALTHGGSWVGTLFLYAPPRIGLSRSEQRLLLSALTQGGTDEELSANLAISVFAVKKAWRSITIASVRACRNLFEITKVRLSPLRRGGERRSSACSLTSANIPKSCAPFRGGYCTGTTALDGLYQAFAWSGQSA